MRLGAALLSYLYSMFWARSTPCATTKVHSPTSDLNEIFHEVFRILADRAEHEFLR